MSFAMVTDPFWGTILVVLFFVAVSLAAIWVYRLRLTPGVSRVSIKVALVAVLAALSLGTDYALAPFPNVKLMDTFVFIGGLLFGLEVGLGAGTVTWLVYGFVNPYGQAGPILPFLIIGESFYAVMGALLGRTGLARQILSRKKSFENHGIAYEKNGRVLRALRDTCRLVVVLGLAGLLGALAYDIFTNTATWFLQLYDPSKNPSTVLRQAFFIGLATMNFPLPMGLLHQASDLFFFAMIVPRAVRAVGRLGWMPTRQGGL